MLEEFFRLTFWGVRGSIPVANKDMMRYGGNTPCIEIEVGNHRIIIDAGSGIIPLGDKIIQVNDKKDIHIFFSHVHWDHIQGFPFFKPAFKLGETLHLYGEMKCGMTIQEQLSGLMREPYWPIGIDQMRASLIFHTISCGETIEIDTEITVSTMRGNHPGNTMLYKISDGKKSICIISDYEHDKELESELISYVQDADLLIYDAFYTDEEYYGDGLVPAKKGWGHSTWQEGCKLAKMANVKNLFLFHHDPYRTDDQLLHIEHLAQKYFDNCRVAREGETVDLYSEKKVKD